MVKLAKWKSKIGDSSIKINNEYNEYNEGGGGKTRYLRIFVRKMREYVRFILIQLDNITIFPY